MSKAPTFVFAAGGTGGHIFPALAMAAVLQQKFSEAKIHFVGTKKGLENKIIPEHKLPLHHLSIGRLNMNVSRSERIKTMMLLPLACAQALYLLLKLRPAFVVGVGGHASGPLLLTASLFGFKTFIWEPNAYPGLANRHLSSHVNKAYVLFEEALNRMSAKKSKIVGYPVRERIENTTRIKNRKEGRFKVFVFGGSQGASAINHALWELIESNLKILEKVEFVHQTGVRDHGEIVEKFNGLSEENKQRIHVHEFVDEMEKYYQWADLVICRSGMGTLAELAAMGLPGLLIPLPTASDDHQKKNAEELVKAEASIMVLQSELTSERLSDEISNLLDQPSQLDLMAENIHKFYRPKAALEIVEDFLSEAEM